MRHIAFCPKHQTQDLYNFLMGDTTCNVRNLIGTPKLWVVMEVSLAANPTRYRHLSRG